MIHGPKGLFGYIGPEVKSQDLLSPKEMLIRSSFPLTSNENYWYNRLLNGISDYTHLPYDPVALANTGDLYNIARGTGVDVSALLEAFRFTGSYYLLETADSWMWVAFQKLGDLDSDGFLEWVRLGDDIKDQPSTYLHQNDQMDWPIALATVVQFVYALKLNYSKLSDTIKQHYQAWMNFLETQAIPEYLWLAGNDVNSFNYNYTFIDAFAHPLAASIRLFHYLWKLTGTQRFLVNRDRAIGIFQRMWNDRAGAYVWDHNPLELRYLYINYHINELWDSMHIQETRYAGLTYMNVIPLFFENIFPFNQKSVMQHFAKTCGQGILIPNDYTKFNLDIGGGITVAGETTYAGPEHPAESLTSIHAGETYGLSYWDTTPWPIAGMADNRVLNFTEQNRSYYDQRASLLVPAYTLAAYLYIRS